ncbi:hypothetical protein Btru_060420 [Bulinus truncatus]|nr:hypothetical protein Btru_060420 [Bulinus truncatus]
MAVKQIEHIACALLLTLLVMMAVKSARCNITQASFTREKFCNLNNRLKVNCARLEPGVFNTLGGCALRCNGGAGCVGVSRAPGGKCFLHYRCALNQTSPNCTNSPNTTDFYRSYVECMNGGVWNSVKKTCQCSDGWVGAICERYATSCAELLAYGYSYYKEHDVTMQLTSKLAPFKGKCNLWGPSKYNTYILKTIGRLKANCRTWEDYVRGFWENSFDFWIGLDNMKAFNDAGYTNLRLDTCFVKNATYNVRDFTYKNFSMTGADRNYTFTFTNATKMFPTHTHGDCLTPVNGAQFSNWDRDNDLDGAQNCANLNEAGWCEIFTLMTDVRFQRSVTCDLHSRIVAGCSYPLDGNVTSWTQCAKECREDCCGVTAFRNGTCILHAVCSPAFAPSSCSVNGALLPQMAVVGYNPCKNSGVWNATSCTYRCGNSRVGSLCERFPTSCSELATHGYPLGSGYYTLQLSEVWGPFKVRCNLVSASVQNTVVMLNNGGREQQQIVGRIRQGLFTTTRKNYWVGLNNFRALNSLGLQTLKLDTNVEALRGAKISVGAAYGDCLTPFNGTRFSAWDKDNDSDGSVTGARSLGAGWWWFTSCATGCNPMGSAGSLEDDRLGSGIAEQRSHRFVLYGLIPG